MKLTGLRTVMPSDQERFNQNITFAQETIKYTVAALPLGACNIRNSKVWAGHVLWMRADASVRTIGVSILAAGGLGLSVVRLVSFMRNFLPLEEFPVLTCLGLGLGFYSALSSLSVEAQKEIVPCVAKAYQMGNCGEHARVALEYLRQTTTPRAEIIADFANDHAFVVIDRDPSSNLSDPTTWGGAAVVCDPWAREYFPASKLKEKLAHILSTHLYPPVYFLKKEDFKVCGSFDNREVVPFYSLIPSYMGGFLSTIVCIDISICAKFKSLFSKEPSPYLRTLLQ